MNNNDRQSESRFVRAVERGLGGVATTTYRHPWLTVAVLLCVTAASLLLARGLRVDGKLARLLPESFRSVQDLKKLQRRFGGVGYVSILAQGAPPAALERLANELVPKLEALPTVRYVDYRRPVAFFRDRALYYLEVPTLERLRERLKMRLRYEQRRANPLYVDLDDEQPPALKLDELLREETKRHETSAHAAVPRDEARRRLTKLAREPYYLDVERRMLVLLVKPTELASDIGFAKKVVAQIRGVLAGVDRSPYPRELRLSLSGRYAKRIEQQAQIEGDLALGFGAAGVLITVFLLLHLRRFFGVVLVLLPLGVGVAATFGFATAVFGSLNILTAFIGAILLGLGIDHGIHLLDRFAVELDGGHDVAQALRRALSHTGRAVVVAALTTVIAFVGLAISEFRAFHEFGAIGAFGVSAIVVTYLLALPPLLRGATALGWRPRAPGRKAHGGDLRQGTFRWASLILWAGIVVVFALSVGASKASFDYDLGSLESKELPSFRLDQEVNRILGHSQTPVVVLTDSQAEASAVAKELRRRKAARGAASTIDFVLDKRGLLADDQARKAPIIAAIDRIARRFELGKLSADEQRKLSELRRMSRQRPFGEADLPESLRRRFGTGKGGFVLAFSRVRLNDGEAVRRLAREVRDLPLPVGTGGAPKGISAAAEAMITADMLTLIEREAPPVLALTGALVFAALWLLVGSLRVAVLALLPALVTLSVTMGLMPHLGLTFTYLNIIMLPVLFGIGVDGGAHLVLHLGGDATPPASGDAGGPGRGFRRDFETVAHPILGALLTTGFGFGALILANQPGIVGVGKLALLGLSLNLVVTLALLPALLAVRRQRRLSLQGQRWGRRLIDALATIGHAGHVPKGGGTVGALAALPFGWALSKLPLPWHLGILALLSSGSVWLVSRYLAQRGASVDADPSEVVLDEFVGVLITLAFIPATLGVAWSLSAAAAGFVLFRAFDIAKPWPIGIIDRRVHGGLGVMLDDIVAGLAAGCTLWALASWLG